MQVVVVKFQDSATFDYWAHVEDLDKAKCPVAYAIGVLVEANSEVTKVALLCSADKQVYSNWVVIPTPCILACDVIKEVDWEVPGG